MRISDTTLSQRIAAAATLLIALLLWLLLILVPVAGEEPVKPQKAEIALANPDDLLDPEEFIEPERLVEDAGEASSEEAPEPEPTPKPAGEPEKGPVNDKVVTSGSNPKPNTSAERLATQRQTSPVKATEPSTHDEPDQKISSEVGGKFSKHNGTHDGKQTGTAGSSTADGKGVSAAGTMGGGRSLKSINKSLQVKLSKPVVVKVEVTVDADGRSSHARCITPGVDASLRRKVEQQSNTARWTPKKGAPNATGTITWTIAPRTN